MSSAPSTPPVESSDKPAPSILQQAIGFVLLLGLIAGGVAGGIYGYKWLTDDSPAVAESSAQLSLSRGQLQEFFSHPSRGEFSFRSPRREDGTPVVWGYSVSPHGIMELTGAENALLEATIGFPADLVDGYLDNLFRCDQFLTLLLPSWEQGPRWFYDTLPTIGPTSGTAVIARQNAIVTLTHEYIDLEGVDYKFVLLKIEAK